MGTGTGTGTFKNESSPVGEEGGETAMLPLLCGMVMESGCMPRLGEYKSSATQIQFKEDTGKFCNVSNGASTVQFRYRTGTD